MVGAAAAAAAAAADLGNEVVEWVDSELGLTNQAQMGMKAITAMTAMTPMTPRPAKILLSAAWQIP